MTVFRRGLLASVVIGVSASAASAATADVRRFNVPSQSARTGIPLFAHQAGIQILASQAITDGLVVSSVRGNMEVGAALRQLLARTDLVPISIGGSFVLKRQSSVGPSPRAAAAMQATPPTAPVAGQQALPALAASEPPPPAGTPEAPSQDIVVTGTLLRGVAPVGTNVLTISRANIVASGATNSAELLAQVPQVTNMFNSLPRAGTGASGTTITRPTIRNITAAGASTTLLLVDGHNIVGAGITTTSSDPEVIPPGVIERVDVVPDGGSSLYGSDAIGGIINFITRKSFDGIELTANAGVADGFSRYQVSGIAGQKWSSGSLVLAYLYRTNDHLTGYDRDYFRQDLTPFGGTDRRVFGCSPGNVTARGVSYALPGRQPGTTNRCDQALTTDIYPAEDQNSAYGSLTQELTSNLDFGVTGFWTLRNTMPRTPQGNSSNLAFTSQNPYFQSITGETAQTVSFNYESVYGPYSSNRTSLGEYGITPTLTAHFGRWQATLLGNYGKSITTAHTGELNNIAQTAALAGTTVASALNPYDIAATDPAVLDLIQNYEQYARAVQQLSEARLNIDGPLFSLPGGDVRLAAGGQYTHQASDAVQTDAPVGDLSNAARASARRDIEAVFAEVRVPVFGSGNAMPGVQSLVLDASVRYDHFSDFGGTTNPKFGMTYEPVKGLRIRANYGTAFNAPSLADTTGAVDTRVQVVDTSPWQAGTYSAANFDRPTILLAGGTSGLKPQNAHTWAVGADFEPKAVSRLTLSATYWSVDLFHQIAQIPFTSPVLYTNPAYAQYFILNPTLAQVQAIAGDQRVQGPALASLYANGAANTPYVLINARRLNLGNEFTRGIDFRAAYTFALGGGDLNLLGGGSYLLSRKNQAVDGDPLFDEIAAGGIGRLQLTGSAGYTIKAFTALATVHHSSGFDVVNIPGQTHVTSFHPVDLFFSYDVPGSGWNKGFGLTLNVTNVGDERPSFINSGNGTGNGGTLGRMFTVGVRKKL
jgi:iron complex outermembrane receptor protein